MVSCLKFVYYMISKEGYFFCVYPVFTKPDVVFLLIISAHLPIFLNLSSFKRCKYCHIANLMAYLRWNLAWNRPQIQIK